MRGGNLNFFGYFKPRRIRVHKDGGDALGAVAALCSGKDRVIIRNAAVGNPRLATVENQVVTVFPVTGTHGGYIGPGIGFRQGKGGDLVPAPHGGEVG